MFVTSCSVPSDCTLVINLKERRRWKQCCSLFLFYLLCCWLQQFRLLCKIIFQFHVLLISASFSLFCHHILDLYSTPSTSTGLVGREPNLTHHDCGSRPPSASVLQASVPVDVMPGHHDPTNYTLPQQPLHRCMFPLSSVYPTLQLVSNPYQADIDGVRWVYTRQSKHQPRWIVNSKSVETRWNDLIWMGPCGALQGWMCPSLLLGSVNADFSFCKYTVLW